MISKKKSNPKSNSRIFIKILLREVRDPIILILIALLVANLILNVLAHETFDYIGFFFLLTIIVLATGCKIGLNYWARTAFERISDVSRVKNNQQQQFSANDDQNSNFIVKPGDVISQPCWLVSGEKLLVKRPFAINTHNLEIKSPSGNCDSFSVLGVNTCILNGTGVVKPILLKYSSELITRKHNFDQAMKKITYYCTILAVLITAIIFLMLFLTTAKSTPQELHNFIFAFSTAVAIIPEGLLLAIYFSLIWHTRRVYYRYLYTQQPKNLIYLTNCQIFFFEEHTLLSSDLTKVFIFTHHQFTHLYSQDTIAKNGVWPWRRWKKLFQYYCQNNHSGLNDVLVINDQQKLVPLSNCIFDDYRSQLILVFSSYQIQNEQLNIALVAYHRKIIPLIKWYYDHSEHLLVPWNNNHEDIITNWRSKNIHQCCYLVLRKTEEQQLIFIGLMQSNVHLNRDFWNIYQQLKQKRYLCRIITTEDSMHPLIQEVIDQSTCVVTTANSWKSLSIPQQLKSIVSSDYITHYSPMVMDTIGILANDYMVGYFGNHNQTLFKIPFLKICTDQADVQTKKKAQLLINNSASLETVFRYCFGLKQHLKKLMNFIVVCNSVLGLLLLINVLWLKMSPATPSSLLWINLVVETGLGMVLAQTPVKYQPISALGGRIKKNFFWLAFYDTLLLVLFLLLGEVLVYFATQRQVLLLKNTFFIMLISFPQVYLFFTIDVDQFYHQKTIFNVHHQRFYWMIALFTIVNALLIFIPTVNNHLFHINFNQYNWYWGVISYPWILLLIPLFWLVRKIEQHTIFQRHKFKLVTEEIILK